MLRRARILLALCALSTLCAMPVLADDGEPANPPAPAPAPAPDPVTELLLWLLGGGTLDEFNPQHLPGG